MSARPPGLTRLLIGWLTPEPDRRFVLGDLDETFRAVARTRGARAARRWYRGQLVRSLPVAAGAMVEVVRSRGTGDARAALRAVRRRPIFALGVSGTLGLGLASAIVLGGITWRVWLRPLPFPSSEHLVRVYELGRPGDDGLRDRGRISPPLLRDLRSEAWTHFTDFGGIASSTPEWVVDDELRQLRGAAVTPGFFELLGVGPLHGRVSWRARDGADVPEVVLSEAFWRQHFGADPSAVGSSLDLGGTLHEIVGVVGQAGGYPAPVDVFEPLVFEERRLGEGMRGARYLEVVARVPDGSSIEAAEAEFAAFIESLGPDHPIHDGWSGEVVSLRADLTGPFRDVLRLLIAAGAAFLTLALVNVVGLTSTRALERRHETGLRVALGASRSRLLRGAWIEGALLGALGGGAALTCALVLFPASIGWLPEDLARSGEVGLSGFGAAGWWLLACALGGAVSLVGLRLASTDTKVDGGVRWTRSAGVGRALVAGQLALTTLLIGVGTVVLERSLQVARHDVGFRPEGVYSAFVALPRSTHEDWEARRDAWDAIVGALGDVGLPAAITTNPPMSGSNANYGYARPDDENESFGQYAVVSADYFDVMGIPILSGRTFERGESAPVTLVSESLAAAHFPGEDPLGQTLSIIGQDHTIVGVVGSTAHFGPDAPVPAAMYVSYETTSWDFAHVVTRGPPSAGSAIADVVQRIAPGATAPNVAPYEVHLANWFRPLRIQLGIVGALGLVGALLAVLGLYASLAYQVRGRLPELGIRAALGATRERLLGGVVGWGMSAAGAGLLGGVIVWWAGRARLAEVLGSPDTGMSLFAVGTTAVLILMLSLVAVALPALRASRADPLESLKAD